MQELVSVFNIHSNGGINDLKAPDYQIRISITAQSAYYTQPEPVANAKRIST